MYKCSVHNTLIGLLATLALAACGAQSAEPEAPEGEAAQEQAAEAEAEAAGESADEAAKETEEKAEPELPDKTPKQAITEEGTVFAFSFPDSDVGQKAEEDCVKKSKDDPEKKAKCMTKAREKFEGEGIRFKKDPEGKWWWITFGKHKGKPADLHRVEFEFGEETPKQITLKLKGGDKGVKRMGNIPRELVIEVPDEYSIVIVDAQRGKLVYKTRVGATDPD
jgi:hypothetical protein